jgi:hypothetical protein
MPIARKPMTDRERLNGEVEWFEALRDSIEDGDIESAIKSIQGAIALKRRERARLNDDPHAAV